MIARLWSARTTPERSASYLDYFRQNVQPELRKVHGFAGATVLTRSTPAATEILVTTYWQSSEAIDAFASPDREAAAAGDPMRNLWRDLQFGLRLLWKTPGFTTVAVLALALGIGANTAIFSVVYATLLAPLPYRQPDRIVMVWSFVGGHRNGIAAGDFLDWKRQNSTFESIAAWTGRQMSLSIANHPETVQAQPATPGFLGVLGQPFLLGRDFLPEEGELGKDHEVILTYQTLEEPFRRRSRHPRQAGSHGRRAIHRRRRARPRRHRSGAKRTLRSAGVQAQSDQPRISLAAGDGSPEAGRHCRPGQRRHGSPSPSTSPRSIRSRIKVGAPASSRCRTIS